LMVGSSEAHRFTIDDVAFLEAFANVVSNAIQRNQTEEKWLLSQRLESLGQLTGGVAHDFNNLLTVMSGNLQILEDTQIDDPYAHRAIAAALRATQRGTELTSKLLAFSRRQTLRPRPIDVAEAIHAFRDLLARTLGENIEITLSVAPQLPSLVADRGQLETALLNLSLNARDAMPNGGKLSIEAAEVRVKDVPMVGDPELRVGHYVRISVSDTGEGMTHETVARAFEPFFTTKSAGKGSGLGLSMVYGFAKQSSGHVTAYSELKIGTTVNLYLPASSETPEHDSETQPGADLRSTHGDETILVVEDDDGVREVAIGFLDTLGYATHPARDRREAIAALKKDSSIALLFSDVVLADGDTGPKVAAVLRKMKPNLRVLFASGYAKSALPLQISRDQDFDFLRKPYSREQLGQSVRAALDARSVQHHAEQKSDPQAIKPARSRHAND
jgi:signal transduction histidine kinase/FixJ family two-component response regulator